MFSHPATAGPALPTGFGEAGTEVAPGAPRKSQTWRSCDTSLTANVKKMGEIVQFRDGITFATAKCGGFARHTVRAALH